MDDRELETLFRAAPGDAPPAPFGTAEVLAASRRATARARMRIATACSVAVLALAGGGIFAVMWPTAGDDESASVTSIEGTGQPRADSVRQESGNRARLSAPKQGDAAAALDARTPGCERADRDLADALAGELPVVPRPADAAVSPLCSDSVRWAAYLVRDGEHRGTVSVTLAPDGTDLRLDLPESSRLAQVPARQGGSVYVLSVPDEGSAAPLADQLQAIAEAIAADF